MQQQAQSVCAFTASLTPPNVTPFRLQLHHVCAVHSLALKRAWLCLWCSLCLHHPHTVCLFTRSEGGPLLLIFSRFLCVCARALSSFFGISPPCAPHQYPPLSTRSNSRAHVLRDASRCGEAQRNTHLDRFARSAGDSIRQYCPGRSRG